MNVLHKSYEELFNLDNIFSAWQKFRRGKRGKKDVIYFELHLEDNLFELYEDLKNFNYEHSSYSHFQIVDNKRRDIHKAKIRDRVVHQIIFDYLNSIFEPKFIADSYSSRKGKGQYKAINTFQYFVKLANDNKPIFVLKCDIRKYFSNIDQNILLSFITQKITCPKIISIITEIIFSYTFSDHKKGIPLGNITSQIFANIYLDSLDKYIKNELRCRFYVRYNDDFIIILDSKRKLVKIRYEIMHFIQEKLLLVIPVEKTTVRKINWGVDFLGFTILPDVVLLRDKTKNKIYTNIKPENLHSYFGILEHCNSHNLKRKILSVDKFTGFWYYFQYAKGF